MQRKRKRTEITVETEEIIIRRGGGVSKGWCSQCDASVLLALLHAAAALADVTPQEVKQGIEARQVHTWETEDGRQMLCLNSLLRWIDSNASGD